MRQSGAETIAVSVLWWMLRKGGPVMPRFALPSHIRSLLVLSLVLAAGTFLPGGVAPEPLAPTGPSYLFLSPNIDDHLSLAEVSRRLGSPMHKHYHQLAGDILRQLGVNDLQVHDAFGDWGDGVENSLLVVLPAAEPQTLRCAAAWFGLLAQQKAVLAFHPDPAGPDLLTTLDLAGYELAAARLLLDQHGVHDRTILVHAARLPGRCPGRRLIGRCSARSRSPDRQPAA